MYCVYIIKSEVTGKYYTGCTDNIERRLSEHNKGRSRYTKRDKPWNLQHAEMFDTLSVARKRERQIKDWKKRSAIDKLISSHRLVA